MFQPRSWQSLAGLAMAGALAAAAAAAQPQRSAEPGLEARYVAWRGGAAFQHLSSVHALGRIETSGLQGALERWSAADGRGWERSAVEGIVTAHAEAPPKAWRTNLSGQVSELGPVEAWEKSAEAQALFPGLLKRMGATVHEAPDEALDGSTWKVLRAEATGLAAFDYFLSSAGELHALRISRSGRNRYIRYSDWRTVEGVRIPFAETVGSSKGADGDADQFASMELNRKLPTGLLRRPPDRVSVARPGRDAAIPFRLFAGTRIYLDIEVNGKRVPALLDSGAETTVVDAATAKRLGLRSLGQVEMQGSGGSDNSGLVTGVRVGVGGQTLSPLTISVLDLRPVARSLDIPLEAILGQEVFNASVIEIDFEHQRIAFHDPVRFRPPTGAARVALKPLSGDRVLPVRVEGGPLIPVYFDLGNGSPFDLFSAYWRPKRLLQDRPNSQLLNGGVGGQRPVGVAVLREVRIGATVFRDVPTNFAPPGPTTQDAPGVLGNVGLPLLSRFRLFVDYPHDALYLSPVSKRVGAPFDKDRAGVSAVREGSALKVVFVAPGSPGQRSGVKAGDRIVAVNGAAIGPDFPQSPLWRWRFGPAGEAVTLTMADGHAVRLMLDDYF